MMGPFAGRTSFSRDTGEGARRADEGTETGAIHSNYAVSQRLTMHDLSLSRRPHPTLRATFSRAAGEGKTALLGEPHP